MELVIISLNKRTSTLSKSDVNGQELHPGLVTELDGVDLTPDVTEPIFIIRASDKGAVAEAEAGVQSLLKYTNSSAEILTGSPVTFRIRDVYSELMKITVPDDLNVEALTLDEIISESEGLIESECEYAQFDLQTKINLYLSVYSCYDHYADEFDIKTKKELRDCYGVSEFDDELESLGI